MAETRPVALITGASSGIGAALAHIFARNGHEVVLAARRVPQLAEIAASIRAAGHRAPHILPVDLARADAPRRVAQELAARNLEPSFLVNNAGYGLLGPAATLDRAEQLAMIDLNCRSLTDLSLRFINSLARHRGGILNVASISGFIPGPGMSVYNASKAYVISFSVGLRRELAAQGHPRHRALPRVRCRPSSRRAPASWTCTIRAASTAPPKTSRGRAIRG